MQLQQILETTEKDYDDDFEMIDPPDVHGDDAPSLTSASSVTLTEDTTVPAYHSYECGNPYCQLSHASASEERASDRAIEPLLEAMQATAEDLLQAKGPIFHAKLDTSITSEKSTLVAETFLGGLPAQYRRVMNCTACKQFMRQYGDLCMVSDDGTLIPLYWPVNDAVTAHYKESVSDVRELFKNKPVGNEFRIYSDKSRIIGTPKTGEWNHMSINLKNVPLAQHYTDSQDTNTTYTMLDRILDDNSTAVIDRVFHIIQDDQLPYTQSHKAPVAWLKQTNDALAKVQLKGTQKQNLVTRYSREAFVGCISSLRGGMMGYLFECVREGQDMSTLKMNWEAKANPLNYLRPTAAPSIGNVESAEKILGRIGYTPRDLERQYLTTDQIPKRAIIWSEEETAILDGKVEVEQLSKKPPKLFGSVLPATHQAKGNALLDFSNVPTTKISMRKLVLKVLSDVEYIEAFIPAEPIGPYFFTTGHDDTKPIMSFHGEGSHTASWYTWGIKSPANHANLKAETWVPVTHLITFPHMWDEFESPRDCFDDEKVDAFKYLRHNISLLFCLKHCKETSSTRELCLFPTLLRGEFHSVRKTIEAFSKKGNIEQPDKNKQQVAGLGFKKNESSPEIKVRIKTKGGQLSSYAITIFE
ncbi:hypothetical protein BP5796_01895 [Coleophoma crateriformis]|uniref:Uncharacterized protein n=1 Tax=Coleophoma crateriformis TaxID=565419 RepID=A0A3D8T246_9HELO|nr:hypothetical protein BP5796_01895 [Coleophoma crateriformis]